MKSPSHIAWARFECRYYRTVSMAKTKLAELSFPKSEARILKLHRAVNIGKEPFTHKDHRSQTSYFSYSFQYDPPIFGLDLLFLGQISYFWVRSPTFGLDLLFLGQISIFWVRSPTFGLDLLFLGQISYFWVRSPIFGFDLLFLGQISYFSPSSNC